MSCKACGGTEFVEEANQSVCHGCGNVLDSMQLVSDTTPLMSTFMKYDNPIDSVAYRNFKKLYDGCTRTLNTPRTIEDEGVLMLPRMWDSIRHRRNKTKRLYLIAMLYLLYRQHQVPVVFTQFLKHAHVPPERLSRISQIVMKQFNLPMFKTMNVRDITANSISELVKLVFKKNSNIEIENETQEIAQRLSGIIYKKGWGETSSKNYISLVSIVATLISAQYVCSNMTNRKTKDGRKMSFRFNTLNYQKLADHMCVHVMAVKKSLKIVQCKLFDVVLKLPWTAAVVKKSINVGQVLTDILDYIDIDVKDELDDIPPTIPTNIKLTLIQAIREYIATHIDIMEQDRPLMDIDELKKMIDKKWKENSHAGEIAPIVGENGSTNEKKLGTIKTENKPVNLEIDNPAKKNLIVSGKNGISAEGMPVYSKDEIEIYDCIIKYHHLELFKDLLLSGCSVKELLDENYIALVEKYVDMPHVKDEHEMEELTDHELSLYFKDPAELISIDDADCDHSESRENVLEGNTESSFDNSWGRASETDGSRRKRKKIDTSPENCCHTEKTAPPDLIKFPVSRGNSDNESMEIEIKEELNSSKSSIEENS